MSPSSFILQGKKHFPVVWQTARRHEHSIFLHVPKLLSKQRMNQINDLANRSNIKKINNQKAIIHKYIRHKKHTCLLTIFTCMRNVVILSRNSFPDLDVKSNIPSFSCRLYIFWNDSKIHIYAQTISLINMDGEEKNVQ